MGYFRNINLISFRNFDTFSIDLSNNCNVLFGKNGSGKTNLLESLSLFSKGRGFRKDKLSNIIKNKYSKFIVKSDFQNNESVYNLLTETYELNKKILKNFSVNNDNSKQTIDSLYRLSPFLIFLPEIERLFLSSPSNRRNFIDRFIYNYNFNYNKLINKYNKNISERSKLLNNNENDEIWLNQIEKNISMYGLEIYEFRKSQINIIVKNVNFFLDKFKLSFSINVEINDKYYSKKISEESYSEELKKNRKIDEMLGGSKIGPHKSDYIFYINNEYLASQLSTGQQKTLILLIYLSQCKHLVEVLEIKPILLLDEICSHLDEINRKILLTLVESFNLQVLMTGTDKNLFSFLSTNTNFYNIT